MAVKSFKTEKRKVETYEFELDGEKFRFTPNKTASFMLPILEEDDSSKMEMIATKGQFDWLHNGLTKAQSKKIIDRLKDPKDDLDVDLLLDIIDWLQDEVSGKATGSEDDSSQD